MKHGASLEQTHIQAASFGFFFFSPHLGSFSPTPSSKQLPSTTPEPGGKCPMAPSPKSALGEVGVGEKADLGSDLSGQLR